MLLCIISAALLAAADQPAFDVLSLADSKRHCFETYAETTTLDAKGAFDTSSPVAKNPVQLCFAASLDGVGWCRWSIKPVTGGKDETSWVLRMPREGKETNARAWLAFSKDWSEDTMTGTAEGCDFVPERLGGGVVLVTLRKLATKTHLSAAVIIGADGLRVDALPPSPKVKVKPK